MSLEEAIRRDIEHDLQVIENSEEILIDDVFFFNNYQKDPVDTARLKDSTYIETSGIKVKSIDIDVAPRIYPLEGTNIISRREAVTTRETAEFVIYGLKEHAKYGVRDFPKDIADKIAEYIDNKEVTINVSDV